MNYRDYIQQCLNGSFAYDQAAKDFIKPFGIIEDLTFEDINNQLNSSFPSTCSEDILPVLSKERYVHKSNKESFKSYRDRTKRAREFDYKKGYKQALIDELALLGCNDVRISDFNDLNLHGTFTKNISTTDLDLPLVLGPTVNKSYNVITDSILTSTNEIYVTRNNLNDKMYEFKLFNSTDKIVKLFLYNESTSAYVMYEVLPYYAVAVASKPYLAIWYYDVVYTEYMRNFNRYFNVFLIDHPFGSTFSQLWGDVGRIWGVGNYVWGTGSDFDLSTAIIKTILKHKPAHAYAKNLYIVFSGSVNVPLEMILSGQALSINLQEQSIYKE